MPKDHGFFIRVYAGYSHHPKTINMKLLLGPEADCYPIRMWTWAAQFARDGVIRGGAVMLEAVLGWTGKAGALHKALMAYPEGFNVGFLESDGITIHDWMDGTGGAIKSYQDKKEKNRQDYEARKKAKAEADGRTGSAGDDSVVKLILDRMKENHITGAVKIKREHIEAWRAAGLVQKAEALIMGDGKAKDIFWLARALNGAPPRAAAPQEPSNLTKLKDWAKERQF